MGLGLEGAMAELETLVGKAIEERPSFVDSATLPEEEATSLEALRWHKVNNIACLCLDMVGSSKIDYQNHLRTSTKIYQAFTGSLVDLWRTFGAGFYDIKGDGGFALFDRKDAIVRAFLAGETFRTFVARVLRPRVSELTKGRVVLGTRTSLSFGTVVVKRIGARGRYNNNLVWLGSTVNQGMKVLACAAGEEGREEFVTTQDAFDRLEHKKIRFSCGCGSGTPSELWTAEDTPQFASIGIDRIYKLRSLWCVLHGAEYFDAIANDMSVALAAAA